MRIRDEIRYFCFEKYKYLFSSLYLFYVGYKMFVFMRDENSNQIMFAVHCTVYNCNDTCYDTYIKLEVELEIADVRRQTYGMFFDHKERV